MKKTYIAPVCEIVKLNKTDIIATSGFDSVNESKGHGTTGGFARGSDGWEDDF